MWAVVVSSLSLFNILLVSLSISNLVSIFLIRLHFFSKVRAVIWDGVIMDFLVSCLNRLIVCGIPSIVYAEVQITSFCFGNL